MTQEKKTFVVVGVLILFSVALWTITLTLPVRLFGHPQPKPPAHLVVTPVRNDLPPQMQIKLLTGQLHRCEQDILDMRVNRFLPWEKRRQLLIDLEQQHKSLLAAIDFAGERLKAQEAMQK